MKLKHRILATLVLIAGTMVSPVMAGQASADVGDLVCGAHGQFNFVPPLTIANTASSVTLTGSLDGCTRIHLRDTRRPAAIGRL